MGEMSGIAGVSPFQPLRRNQRAFRCRRHFPEVDVIVQEADMVAAPARKTTLERSVNFSRPGFGFGVRLSMSNSSQGVSMICEST